MADKVTPHRGGHAEPTNLADTRQHSERNKVVWLTDIFDRIVEPTPHITEFLETFVPSPTNVPNCPDRDFAGEVPTGPGREPQMYEPLIIGLTSLVRKFPAGVIPTFHNRSHEILKPPFALCDKTEHETMPDIVVTVPNLPQLAPLQRWRNVALVFEVKAEASDDPMEKHSDEHEKTLIQLAKSARNIMLAQGRLFAFVVGIYGDMARIFRFDRAGAVCSPLFDYVLHPEYLHGFLWRFVHPGGRDCVVLGDDPTTSLGSKRDRGYVRRIAKEYDPSYQHTEENQKAIRRFTVTDEDDNKKEYLAYKLIFVNTRLCSRASMIWEAFELDEKGEATGVRVVIKDAWRQFERPSEITHYRDLQEAAESTAEDAAAFLSGFAEFGCGDDLGLRETRDLTKAGHAITSDQKPFAGSVDTLDECQLLKLSFSPAVVPGHRTVSACCRHAPPTFERGHIRLVIKTVGTPITDFESTYDMVCGIRDAIKAHKRAYEAGILHRDISRGNVMLRRKADGSVGGFLHDFDYASNWKRFLADMQSDTSLAAWHAYTLEEYKKDMAKRNEKKKNKTEEQKQRTGTIYFMAVEILDKTFRITHEARHDLESFYWLLVWIVLRHVTCESYRTWHELFDCPNSQIASDVKRAWLNGDEPRIIIDGNEALTELLEQFRLLCFRNAYMKEPEQRMTHNKVLRIFSFLLKRRTDWPEAGDDRANPWVMPA
ncbi:hypothetical protein FOMPIDRAFT_1105917, partial [Fomitopsis schrenkii]